MSTPAAARRWAVGTWAAAGLYFASLFDRGWIPHDEGTLGQTAWRILLGEVPHRDFDALYTGLLGYLNAGAMAVFGTNLLAPRVVLLLAFLAWTAVVWRIAARFVEPPVAAATTLMCVTIGPAVYPAAMPSWYNLFLATGGLWALIRWTEDGRSRWLVAAGALAGVSVLFKSTGLYFLAAALFTVLHVEVGRATPRKPGRSDALELAPAERSSAEARQGQGTGGRAWVAVVPLALTLPLVALVLMVVALVRSQLGAATTAVHYVMPTLALATLAAWQARRLGSASPSALRRVAAGWTWVAGAFLAPVGVFVGLFAAAGAAADLYHGVFVLPTRRLVTAASMHLPLRTTSGILLPLALVVLERRLGPSRRGWVAGAVGMAGLALLALSRDREVYRAVWLSLPVLVPVAVTAGTIGAYRLVAGGRAEAPPAPLLAVLWAAALTSLLQFPLAGVIYFAHIAPMGVLAAVATLGALPARRQADGPLPAGLAPPAGTGAPDGARTVLRSAAAGLGRRPVLLAVMLFYVVYIAWGPNRSGYSGPPPDTPFVRLALDRGLLRVSPRSAEQFPRLVAALQELSRSDWIYVTPDAPEVYFLSGFRNPTRTLFEIFDEPGSSGRIPSLLDGHDVNVVVLNTRPGFSRVPDELVRTLEADYPRAARIGKFVVRWR